MTRRLAAVLALSLLLVPVAARADDEPKTKDSVVWQNDPVCRTVFFAVLEGLYTDGVQDEVVDLVIGAKPGAEAGDVQRCFVFQCELCHAVFEAFTLYRGRQTFQDSMGKTTFGPGVDAGIVKDLASDDARTRVYAMGGLIRPWIQRKIDSMRLSKEELMALHDRIAEYADEGRKLLSRHKAEPNSVYVEWDFYGTCQACEAADDISRMLRDKKE